MFQYDPAGTQLRSLYRYDMATGEVTLAAQGKTRYPHVWSRQGSWIAFDSAERNDKDRDLYVMQPAVPSSKRRLADFDGAYNPQDWSPDGSTLLAIEMFANAETYLWRVDVKTGAKTALTPRDGEKASWFNARFSSDGKQVYAVSDRTRRVAHLAVRDRGLQVDLGPARGSRGRRSHPLRVRIVARRPDARGGDRSRFHHRRSRFSTSAR